MYLGSGDDFTALHAVTGTHAYRMIEPFVDPPIARPGGGTCGRRWWRPMSRSGRRHWSCRPAAKLPSWTEVAARAAASSDDHQIKLTDVAREESRHWNESGGLYLQAAATHLGLV